MKLLFWTSRLAVLAVCGATFAGSAQTDGEVLDLGLQDEAKESAVDPVKPLVSGSSKASVVSSNKVISKNKKLTSVSKKSGASANKTNSASTNEESVAAAPGIIILNQGNANPSTQQQPTTYVEASPSPESRTEQFRRARQDAEANTEKLLSEKLEESRLLDERRRLEKILGNTIEGSAINTEPQQPQQQQQNTQGQGYNSVQKVQVINEAPRTFGQENESMIKEKVEKIQKSDLDLVQEVEESETAAAKQAATVAAVNPRQYYLGGAVGSASYVGVVNVQGNMAAGVTFGSILPTGVSLEASFMYSNFYIDEYWWNYPYFREMDQYSLGLGAKYNFSFGIVKPNFGGLISYNYRKYFDRGYYSYGYSNDSEVTSHAVDLGLTAGVDVDITETFSLGFEYRYMTNLANRADSDYLTSRSVWRDGQPVERTDYNFVTLTGKLRF
jgi:hypothetical protein